MNLEQERYLFNAQYYVGKVFELFEGAVVRLTDVTTRVPLLLRSITKLTDDECVKLASIVIENPFNRYRNIEVIRNYAITGFPYISVAHKNVKYRFEIDCTHINFSVYDMGELCGDIDMKPYACIDYLRSIGILLPFTYLDESNKPVTLQPDNIVELGWAKLTNDILKEGEK